MTLTGRAGRLVANLLTGETTGEVVDIHGELGQRLRRGDQAMGSMLCCPTTLTRTSLLRKRPVEDTSGRRIVWQDPSIGQVRLETE